MTDCYAMLRLNTSCLPTNPFNSTSRPLSNSNSPLLSTRDFSSDDTSICPPDA